MGEVFSRAAGFRTLSEMIPPLAFHVVCSAAGMTCFVHARRRRDVPAPIA